MTDAERSRVCYLTNEGYRERAIARGKAWAKANRGRVNELARIRRGTPEFKAWRARHYWETGE